MPLARSGGHVVVNVKRQNEQVGRFGPMEKLAMKYHALAVDYDGTLATDGRVDPRTLEAVHRLKKSGRRLILVTGRIIQQLRHVFPQMGVCDLVVADNGALLYDPRTNGQIALTDPPPKEFVRELTLRGVAPIEVGDVIVATWEPHESTVLQVIHDLGLELQIIFNKGAVMILPTGCNKATGLRAALTRLEVSHHNTVGIGDAENDEAFLRLCAASAAVDNALDVVKRQVDMVTKGARGEGVIELIERILADDLQSLSPRPDRGLLVGLDFEEHEFRVPLYGSRILMIGESADVQAQYVLHMLQQLIDQDYQACLFTADSEYLKLQNPVVLGNANQKPDVEEVLQVVQDPYKSCIVSLQNESPALRAIVFREVLEALLEYRHKTGHPNLLLVDDAEELISGYATPGDSMRSDDLKSALYITSRPERISKESLRDIDLVIAVGPHAESILSKFIGAGSRWAIAPKASADGVLPDSVAWRRGDSNGHRLRVLLPPQVGRTATAPIAVH
jgi:hydroxymethylpyrimidine pyrophosphatase-like HAD family hydrolase